MTVATDNKLATAIESAFISPNELDSNWEVANIVDVIGNLARCIYKLAETQEKQAGLLERQTVALEKIAKAVSPYLQVQNIEL